MKIRPIFTSFKKARELISFSGMAFLGSLGYLLYYATDSIIISNLNELGPEKIIAYNLAQRWDPTIRGLILALAFSLTPAMTSLVAVNDLGKLKRVLFRGTRYCLLIGLLPCVLLAAYSSPFILLWVGESFIYETPNILFWLMVNLAVSIPLIMGYQVLFALGKLREATVSTILGGMLNIILSIILVKYFQLGLMGVALGTIISLSLKNTLYLPYIISKKMSIKLSEYFFLGYIHN